MRFIDDALWPMKQAMSDGQFVARVFLPAAVALFYGLRDPLCMNQKTYRNVNVRLGTALLAISVVLAAASSSSDCTNAICLAAWIVGLGLLLTPLVAHGWIAWQVALGAMKWPSADDTGD